MNEALAFLAHEKGDSVAVAVRDVEMGPATVAYLDSKERTAIEVAESIPLGHKIALTALEAGESVIEYGEIIGTATSTISEGSLVHVHNIRSNKWQVQR